jgi:hypothetical protein
MSIDKLLKQIEKEVKLAEEEANKQARAAAFIALNNVITRTPVGNDIHWKSKAPAGYTGGQLRGNWQASIDSIKTNELDREQKGDSGSATSELSGTIKSFTLDNTLYFSNNLPYAERINNGWSVQPGVGVKWVDKEVAKYNSILEQLIKKNQL